MDLMRSQPHRIIAPFIKSEKLYSSSLFTLTICLLIVGAGTRIFQWSSNRSLWLDEAMLARNILEKSPIELLGPLEFNQGAPILFLLLVDATTTLLGTQELALRLIPLLFSLIGLLTFYKISRLLLDPRFVPIAVGPYSLTYPLIYYSQELKQYASDATVTTILTYSFATFILSPNQQKSKFTQLGIIGCLAILTSHPAIFIISGICLSLIIMKSKNLTNIQHKHLASVITSWIFIFTMNYTLFLHPLTRNQSLTTYWETAFLPFPNSIESLKEWREAAHQILNYSGFPIEWHTFAITLALVAIATTVPLTKQTATTSMLLLSISFGWTASILGKYPLAERLTLWLFPIIFLLVAKGSEQATVKCKNLTISIFSLILIAPWLWKSHNLITPIQREEVKPLLAYIETKMLPDDHIYVYYAATHATKYYTRHNKTDNKTWHFGQMSRDDNTIYRDDIESLKKFPRVWFLFSHTYKDEEAYFRSHFDTNIVEKRLEPGASLYLCNFEQTQYSDALITE